MENPDRGKTETDFIQFGTELILETLAEEYPNKAFKIDEVSIKSNNAYHFFVEDPMWDNRIKIVLAWEDFRDKSRNELKLKARGHISDFYSTPDFFGDLD